MRVALLIVLVTLATGAAAVGGSMLGAGIGGAIDRDARSAGLFTGAALGGALGVTLGAWLAALLGAGARSGGQFWATVAGGMLGFALAVPIAVTHLSGPLIPVLSTLLPGIGAAVASGIARRGEHSRGENR